MAKPSFDLQKHLEHEHQRSPLSTYLKEIVYGGTDGIITTFAVVAGFAGAGQNPASELPILAVLLFGFANLFADGVSMALGNFLSTRAEQEVYAKEKKKERHEIQMNPHIEKEESEAILIQKGFTSEQARQLIAIYMTNEPYWLEFMMKDELEMANPEGENPTLMATATFISFIGFGVIPLLPYVFFRDASTVFFLSILATASAMISIGLLRWKVTKRLLIRSVGETLLLGGTAAAIAYFVGTLFHI